MAEQTLFLGEKTDGSFWTGAVLIESVFVVGGAAAYLRYVQGQSDQVRFRLSSTATGDSLDAGPDLVPEWENYAEALTFEADGAATVVLKGPAHPDNSFDDPSEPYHWIPDNGAAWQTYWQDANGNIRVTLKTAGPPGVEAAGSLTGGLVGTISGLATLSPPPVLATGSLDAGLSGNIGGAATLGDLPPVVGTATLDAGLAGSISGAASLGQVIAITATATLTGGLTGSISGGAIIADATVPRRIVGLIANPNDDYIELVFAESTGVGVTYEYQINGGAWIAFVPS